MNEELLDLSDIANLYRVSRRYARDVLVKSPGFPMPVLAISQKTRRWSVAELHYLGQASAKVLASFSHVSASLATSS